MAKIDLNQQWELTWEDLAWGPEKSPFVLEKPEGWLQTELPCDVRMPLLAADIIKEPLDREYSYESSWIEEKSWWFKKVFQMDAAFLAGDVIELTLDSLDANADVFLNGVHLGNQKSAFYPFVREVKPYLKSGPNVLLVRVTSGLEHFSEQDIAAVKKFVCTERERGYADRGDPRRSSIRKPQYVFGWDWCPRIATCGIVKNVWIESYTELAVRSAHVVTQSLEQGAELEFTVETENFDLFSTLEAVVRLEMEYDGITVFQKEEEVFLRSGLNYIRLTVQLPDAKLWWPNGMGPQNLYRVKISVATDRSKATYPEFRYGIRQIRLNQERLNQKERLFAIEVNGVKALCKGGNWIPADSVYARVSNEKYRTLLCEARDANFNMLRIWGGGIYERDIFYELCDEYGILLWHDFMFACALYPDYLESFRRDVETELNHQTRRLRNHPCIALWCGNNENHWGFDDWWHSEPTFFGGAECYHRIAPQIVETNCPEIPYWNSSPYGGKDPNGNDAGDRHHWRDCTMSAEMADRISPEAYDKIEAKFITEYGYIGPCRKSSIIRYHAGEPLDQTSSTWQHHNNTFEKGTVLAGIEKHYRDAGNLSLDEYLLYAGLCQGMMLGYSLEAIRFKENCSGSLFWMYNDCWGEVGWTMIDYYLKRKPSYYYVKRAFAPLKLIMRENGGMVRVMGINETAQPVKFTVEYGFMTFDGTTRDTSNCQVELGQFSRGICLEFPKKDYDFTRGTIFVRPTDTRLISPATLRSNPFRNLKLPQATLTIKEFKQDGEMSRLIIGTDYYAHAVHFNLRDDVNLSDEYFDLLPGEEREILIYGHDIAQKDLKPFSVCG